MPSTFKQLPIDGLITTWRSKLPPNVSEAYVQMGRIIAERDLNLAILFSELVTASGIVTPSLDAYTVTNVSTDKNFDPTSTSLDETAMVLANLIQTLQSTGIIQ